MKLGTETGSLINHVMTNCKQKVPVIGEGATKCLWSDRHAGTIVAIILTKAGKLKEIHWQVDVATRIDKNGMSDSQKYSYTPNLNAPVEIFKAKKNGSFKSNDGSVLAIGTRDSYYDYSF